jgi:hypothetical protein
MIDDRIVVAHTSLTPESARRVRFERLIAIQSNAPEKARMQGFLDYMMGHESKRGAYSVMLQVSYDQGRRRGLDKRLSLNGKPWIETSQERNGSKWSWAVYCEGYWRAGGEATSQSKAYDAIIDARVEIAEEPPSTNGAESAQTQNQRSRSMRMEA